ARTDHLVPRRLLAERQQPGWHGRQSHLLGVVTQFPGVLLATGVQARRYDHVAAVPPDVEPGAERLYAILDRDSRVGEEVLDPAATGEVLHRLGQGLIGTLQLAEALVAAFVVVDGQDVPAGARAGSHADSRVWPGLPPAPNGGGVGGGVFEPVFGARVLADAAAVAPAGTTLCRGRVAGNDRPATLCAAQCRVKLCAVIA